MNGTDTLMQRYRERRREAEGVELLFQVRTIMQVMHEDGRAVSTVIVLSP